MIYYVIGVVIFVILLLSVVSFIKGSKDKSNENDIFDQEESFKKVNSMLEDNDKLMIQSYIQEDKLIHAIKLVRDITNVSLKEAKNYVDLMKD